MNSTNRKRSHDSIEKSYEPMENHIEQEVNSDTFSTDLQERYGVEGVEDISDIQKALAHLISVRLFTFDLNFIYLFKSLHDIFGLRGGTS